MQQWVVIDHERVEVHGVFTNREHAEAWAVDWFAIDNIKDLDPSEGAIRQIIEASPFAQP